MRRKDEHILVGLLGNTIGQGVLDKGSHSGAKVRILFRKFRVDNHSLAIPRYVLTAFVLFRQGGSVRVEDILDWRGNLRTAIGRGRSKVAVVKVDPSDHIFQILNGWRVGHFRQVSSNKWFQVVI